MRDWLAHRVAASPDAEALVAAESGRTWTYADLHEAADAMARRLAGIGVGPGDHVGACMRPRPKYVTLIHAAMRVGARLVPLDPELTPPELESRIARADIATLVCDRDTEAPVTDATAGDDGADPPVASVDPTSAERVTHLRTAATASVPTPEWTRSDSLLMLYTSGTTGSPKLPVLQAGNVLTSVVASAFRLGLTPADRVLASLSFHHAGGIMPVYRATLYGTSLVIRDEFDPGQAADDLRAYDVTVVSLVPTMLRRMLDARGTLADSLRVVLLGGAPASDELIERCRAYSVPVHPTYGTTETASGIAIARPDQAFDRVGSVGRPLFWTDLSVRDEDGGELPPGEVGEFVVSGPTVTPGYYGDDEATEAAFGPAGLHTGDVGYRDEDGYVYVLNRLDDRILTGGENVDPGEVIDVLRDHDDVVDASVVGLPDEEWGERVAALVVPADPSLSRADVESFCEPRLAGYKHPRTVAFASELPRTVSGTVDREAVRDRLAEVNDGAGDGGGAGAEAPDEDAHADG